MSRDIPKILKGTPVSEPNEIPTETLLLRVRDLLADAMSRLDRRDYAERVGYCQDTGEHGVRMHLNPDDSVIEFRWGGRPLAMIPRDVLLDEQPLPEPQFIAETPDTVPDEWSDQ